MVELVEFLIWFGWFSFFSLISFLGTNIALFGLVWLGGFSQLYRWMEIQHDLDFFAYLAIFDNLGQFHAILCYIRLFWAIYVNYQVLG